MVGLFLGGGAKACQNTTLADAFWTPPSCAIAVEVEQIYG